MFMTKVSKGESRKIKTLMEGGGGGGGGGDFTRARFTQLSCSLISSRSELNPDLNGNETLLG